MSLRKSNLRNEHSEVDTGPLNDILFILLMFFLMISTLANPNVIKLSVPRSKSDTKQKQSVVVSVNKNKDFYIGTKKIISDSLLSELRKYINEGDSVTATERQVPARSACARRHPDWRGYRPGW